MFLGVFLLFAWMWFKWVNVWKPRIILNDSKADHLWHDQLDNTPWFSINTVKHATLSSQWLLSLFFSQFKDTNYQTQQWWLAVQMQGTQPATIGRIVWLSGTYIIAVECCCFFSLDFHSLHTRRQILDHFYKLHEFASKCIQSTLRIALHTVGQPVINWFIHPLTIEL